MDAYNLLSPEVKHFIRDQKWKQLRPVQLVAINEIITTNNNYIISSATASGKTEAAFLPILSLINYKEKGVKVLYISPLKALINDQLNRVLDLCKYLDIPVTSWHGDSSYAKKKQIINNPSGVVLITPESLESILSKDNTTAEKIFGELEFIIIDEIHVFLDSIRGKHLQSLLSRLKNINKNIRFIGLSATLGDIAFPKFYFGDNEKTKVIIDKSKRSVSSTFNYFDLETNQKDSKEAFFKKLHEEIISKKVLIFPNSRQKVEEIATILITNSDKNKDTVFAHHAMISKNNREEIEHFAKNSKNKPFTIVCTSTLELGIDIGDIDKVIQIDSTFSVSSLVQRFGRSGRESQQSNLVVFATDKWSLLHSIACFLLYKDGFIEAPKPINYPIDILFFQILSIFKKGEGKALDNLQKELTTNFAFNNLGNPNNLIDETTIRNVIFDMESNDFIKKYGTKYYIGHNSEDIIFKPSYYTSFSVEKTLKAYNKNRLIGEISVSTNIKVGDKLFLASKTWEVKFINYSNFTVELEITDSADTMKIIGSQPEMDSSIFIKMFEILTSTNKIEILNDEVQIVIDSLRNDFSYFKVSDVKTQRFLKATNKSTIFYSFTGTKINRTILFLLQQLNINCYYNSLESSIKINTHIDKIKHLFNLINNNLTLYISNKKSIEYTNKMDLELPKWGIYLDNKFKVKIYESTKLDFIATQDFLNRLELLQ